MAGCEQFFIDGDERANAAVQAAALWGYERGRAEYRSTVEALARGMDGGEAVALGIIAAIAIRLGIELPQMMSEVGMAIFDRIEELTGYPASGLSPAAPTTPRDGGTE